MLPFYLWRRTIPFSNLLYIMFVVEELASSMNMIIFSIEEVLNVVALNI